MLWFSIQMEIQSLSQQHVGWRRSLVFIITCLECLLSSHLHRAHEKKMLSHLYLSVSLTLLTALFVWYIQVYVCMYITYMLYAELCFYSIYNMSRHIIYLICKRKFFSSVISHLETCGNEFACVCSFFLQYQGWQLPVSPTHLRTDLGRTKTLLHVAEDDQRLFLPH